jgi:hypothetical protein
MTLRTTPGRVHVASGRRTEWRGRCVAALRYGWAAPATLAGLAVTLFAFAAGARARIVDGTIEVAGGRIAPMIARLPRRYRFCAITLGHVIICTDECTAAAVRAHEHAHVRQYERWGLLFFALYAASSLLQWLRGGDPYLDNRFEREARLAAGR